MDEELDEVKRTYAGLDDLLSRAARNIGDSIPADAAQNLEVVYIPQLGFLIAMPIDPATRQAQYEGGEGDEAWRRFFSTSDKIFFKDFRMAELDEVIGDLHGNICGLSDALACKQKLTSKGREIDILYQLAQRVLQYETILCRVSEIIGELDRYIAHTMAPTDSDFLAFWHLLRVQSSTS